MRLPHNTRRSRWRAVAAVVTGVVTLLAAGMTAAVGAQAAVGCRVDYSVAAQWRGGFTADVKVTNLGDRVDGWRLEWAFPSGQRVTQAWNAAVESSGGQVTARNASYNTIIAANAAVSFGFNGSWSGSNAVPVSFALNGITCTGSTVQPTTTPPQPGDAMARVAAMQPGWNLGNSFDAVGDDETAWGNPRVTPDLLDHVRAQGFNSIRIPVTWSNRHGPAPDYAIDPAWLSRVREVVDWALADGFHVMINLHHDSWQWINTMPTDRANALARYTALWTQITTAFRDHSPRLVFESVNEPQFTGSSGDAQDYELLHELNAEFHRIVRASGGNNATRLLVLPTLLTNADQGRLDALTATFDRLDDPDLAATVHFYGFWPFSVNVAGHTRYNAEVEEDLTDTFDRVHAAFVARGIPVVLGEYGLLGIDYTRPGILQRGEVLKFFEAFGHHARTRNITTMLWDAGSFLHRPELRWRDPDLAAQITSSWTTRSGTAAADQLYVPRSSAVTDKTLALNLNGTTFQGLGHGNTDLTAGRDYTVSGSTLTLTASALTRLVGDRTPGVNSTVEARFSRGVPWRISIITHDAPVLSGATGSTNAFAIPTRFLGDQLATMEARYADGSNAGPHNWTSFKEFYVNFQPDYGANTILVKPEFFNEVDDGAPVTLTFHFWSGTRITYHVTKTGSTVTGTTG